MNNTEETDYSAVVAMRNQALANKQYYVAIQFTEDSINPSDVPWAFHFRFPDYLFNEYSINSIYQIEIVSYALIRSAPPAVNSPLFIFSDIIDDVKTPFFTLINSNQTDGISYPVILNDRLKRQTYNLRISFDKNGRDLAIGSLTNITDIILVFKYTIRNL